MARRDVTVGDLPLLSSVQGSDSIPIEDGSTGLLGRIPYSTIAGGGMGSITSVTSSLPIEASVTGGLLTIRLATPIPAQYLPVIPPSQGGVPAGGFDGQVLAKDGSANYVTEWRDPSAGGGGGAGDITAVLAGPGLIGGGTIGALAIGLDIPVAINSGGTAARTAPGARSSLGLGSSSTLDFGTGTGDLVRLAGGALFPITVIPTITKGKGGVSPGGSSGQVLSKVTSNDYDTQWIDSASGAVYTDGDTSNVIDRLVESWSLQANPNTQIPLSKLGQSTLIVNLVDSGSGIPGAVVDLQWRCDFACCKRPYAHHSRRWHDRPGSRQAQ